MLKLGLTDAWGLIVLFHFCMFDVFYSKKLKQYPISPYSAFYLSSTCVCVCVCVLSHVQLFAIPFDCNPTRLHCPWNFPGKTTGVGCHFLLQAIFPTRRSNRHLLVSPAGRFFTTAPPRKPNSTYGNLKLRFVLLPCWNVFLIKERRQEWSHSFSLWVLSA